MQIKRKSKHFKRMQQFKDFHEGIILISLILKIYPTFTPMKGRIQRFFSLFILFLFLFPSVEIGIHDVLHRNDEVCLGWSLKHFHQKEHSCPLCEYGLSFTGSLPEQLIVPSAIVFTDKYTKFNSCFYPIASSNKYAPRGPPAI